MQYTFPSWNDAIGCVGLGADSLAEALRFAGYHQAKGDDLKQGVPETSLSSFVSATSSLDGVPPTFRTIVLIDLLQHLEREALEPVLQKLGQITGEFVVTSISTYPDALLPLSRPGEVPAVLETRAWWNQMFARYGFEALTVPLDNLSPLAPFVYRKAPQARAPGEEPTRTPRHTRPKAVFLLPSQENAFLWVIRDLANAMGELSFPALIQNSPGARAASSRDSTHKVTWAHFWPAYRRLAQQVCPGFEVFVSNFYLKRKETLSGWLAELCGRSSHKLPVSHFAKDVLLSLGVPQEKITVVPHGYSPEFASEPEPLPLATRKSFRFLAVVNSYDPYRYGLDLLMKAYRQAFGSDDDVCLVIKDYGPTSGLTRSLLGEGTAGPEVLYYANFFPKSELASFYAAHSAFVAPFRGEGFGMKILDAATVGLPLIMPHFGGPVDYCPEDCIESVSYRLTPVGRCLDTEAFDWNEALTWCEPDVGDLAASMQRLVENDGPAKEKAARLKRHVVENFSWRCAAQTLIASLNRARVTG